MSLTYQTLDGETVDRVAVAIERIRSFVPEEGYQVSFSGGKDSIVVLDLVRLAGVKYDAVFNLTTVDPPEVVRFIREHYPDVQVSRPKISMFGLIVKKHFPPTRQIRYCCDHLKERGGKGRTVITGVRWQESPKRKTRHLYEVCQRDKTQMFLHPIIDWSSDEVWEYIHSRNLAYPSPYDNGYTRIGCVMCPMGGQKGMQKDAKNYPKIYNAYLMAFDRMLKKNQIGGHESRLGWKTPEDVMSWWIEGKTVDHSTVQQFLDEGYEPPVDCYGVDSDGGPL